MRILLASSHRFPAFGSTGSGMHPREYPSGSAYHLHDLLAQGLAEEGHEVSYYLEKGAAGPAPPGVTLVPAPISEFDVCHAPIGPPDFAESILEFTTSHRKPCLLTCHMKEAGRVAEPNWLFVSRALAQAYGSDRFILNGIDPNEFIFSETKEDYLLFMGAMNRAIDKGLDLALSLARSKRIRLIVAGTGLNYETIRRVSDLCAEAGAEYLGDVRGTRKAELLAGARALLFPSRLNEGCPLVILEAMVSGTPVISSRSGGAVEIVTPETGILCSQDDEWSGAVDRVSGISPLRCREIALEKYHYRRMVKDHLAEYRREVERFGG
ncbi:MAG TPA: glycosyltransferase [Bryobacteraceae bacterium]|nr:glycosyltransferase [Bryobacteraceae bacterium]